MKEEILTLNETFREFRYHCEFRRYYRRYTNNRIIDGDKVIGQWDMDYGLIKCAHLETTTGWCRKNTTAEDCPRYQRGSAWSNTVATK